MFASRAFPNIPISTCQITIEIYKREERKPSVNKLGPFGEKKKSNNFFLEHSSDRIWRRECVEEMDKILNQVHGKRKRQISPTFLLIQKTQQRNTQISSNYNKRRYFYTIALKAERQTTKFSSCNLPFAYARRFQIKYTMLLKETSWNDTKL